MSSGTEAANRCPTPLKGNADFKCQDGLLTVVSYSHSERVQPSELPYDLQAQKQLGMRHPFETECNNAKRWAWDTLAGCYVFKRGYFKFVGVTLTTASRRARRSPSRS